MLGVGAWNGFYSFAAERVGGPRVVSLDHHVWGLDREAKNRYKAECGKRGDPQRHPRDVPGLWRFDELHGKRRLRPRTRRLRVGLRPWSATW